MSKDLKRILIESTLNKTIKDAKESPRRTLRNLIDMGLIFSKGQHQKDFLNSARALLQNEDSQYYKLAEDIFFHVNENFLFRFGINLGYNGCVKGADRIREKEREKEISIPWSLSIIIDDEKLKKQPQIYQKIIEEGMGLGIYVYRLFLIGGDPERVIGLMERYPDCAFAVFLKHTVITDRFIRRMTELGIALTSVCADEKTENICRKFREAGLLFAVCCRYQEREKERLLSEQWFVEVTRYSPHFVFLYPDASCSSQARNEIYRRILEERRNQKQPFLCMDLIRDFCEIDQMISAHTSILGFHRDGSPWTYNAMKFPENYNIFEESLEEILKKTAL